MTRRTTIQTDCAEEIENAVSRFGDHEDMSAARVVLWLEQFDEDDLALALKVIDAVHYFGASNVRALTRELFEMVESEMARQSLRRAAFVAVGRPGGGSSPVARVLKESIRETEHEMLSMTDLAEAEPGRFDAVVFVEDFSGTGNTLVQWWETVEPMVRPTNAVVFVALLVVNEPAYEPLESFASKVLAVTELGAEDNVLSGRSSVFDSKEKPTIRHYCVRTQAGAKYEKGYGECGLMVAFKHGCPNNSLPILWMNNAHWRALFHRRAI